MFSCEFCEISKNTFSTEHPQWLLLHRAQLRFSNRNDRQKINKQSFVIDVCLGKICDESIFIKLTSFITREFTAEIFWTLQLTRNTTYLLSFLSLQVSVGITAKQQYKFH